MRRCNMEGTYVYNKDMLVKNVNMDLRASYIFVNYETGKVIVTVGTPTFIDNMNDDIILKTYVFSEKPKYDIVKPYAFKEDGTGFYTYYCNIETDRDKIDKLSGLILYRENH